MPVWTPSHRIAKKPDHLLYEVATNGDAYFSVPSPLSTSEVVLIRVSSHALIRTTRFFAAQFKLCWMPESGKFTIKNPLVFQEHFDEFVTFLHIASEDNSIPASADYLLMPVAVLLDKYLFNGSLPSWCEQSLKSYFPLHFPFYNDVEVAREALRVTGSLPAKSLPSVFQCAYLLNIPSIFAIASRRIMWQMSVDDLRALLPDDLEALLPNDFVARFERDAVRLRGDLVSKLPTVFYPDAHGGDTWWCSSCHSVPNEERWYREVIRKSRGWNIEQDLGPVERLGDLFAEYIRDMTRLESLRELEPSNAPPFPCGRFRLRYSDTSDREMLLDVYVAIGGLCLPCVKAGEVKFCSFCSKHNLDLTRE